MIGVGFVEIFWLRSFGLFLDGDFGNVICVLINIGFLELDIVFDQKLKELGFVLII